MRSSFIKRTAIFCAAAAVSTPALAAPMYTITNLGPYAGQISSGQGISTSGNYACGFTVTSTGAGTYDAFIYNVPGASNQVQPDGVFGTSHPYSFAVSVNNSGLAVGRATTTSFGSGPLPIMWQNGVATPLPMPGTNNAGRAYSVNNAGTAVGSVQGGAGDPETATIFTSGSAQTITATLNGGRLNTAYGINDNGKIVGQAIDPNNAAALRPFIYDMNTNIATDLGVLAGQNAGIAFGVSSNNKATGVSQFNGGGGLPFIWDSTNGMQPIPIVVGASTASGRGVNANGWVVGVGSGQFAVPFLYDGAQSYDLETLLTNGAGWDLNGNTSSAALSIADNNSIVGVALFNGVISAYLLTPVPEPASAALLGLFALPMLRRRR